MPSDSSSNKNRNNGDADGGHSERQPLLSRHAGTNYGDLEPHANAAQNENRTREARNSNETPERAEDALQTRQLLGIMSGVYLGATLSALDGTLIATLVTPISNSLNSATLFAWLAAAYFIANAAFQPLAGKVSDIYGRKACMLFSNILFAMGNLICGLARSELEMIGGRVIAGLGGGGIGPIATCLISDLVPLRRRGVWQGFANICFGIGSSLGGPVGGFVNDTLGWRWAFLLQVPLTIVTVILVFFLQNAPQPSTSSTSTGQHGDEPGRARWKRVDFAGATCLASSLVLMLTGLNAGGNIVSWSHPLVLCTLPISAILLACFVLIERNFAREPIVPLDLLAHRTILASCFANWFISAARFAFFFYIPIYFYLQGLSATSTGIRMIPESVAIGVTSVLFGFIMRSTGRYYWLGAASGIAICLGMALLLLLPAGTATWLPLVSLGLVGFGFSGMLSVTIIAMIASAEHKYQAVITSVSYAFRSTGTTIGITLASVLFQNQLRTRLQTQLGHLPGSADLIKKLRDNLGELNNLPETLREPVILSYLDSLHTVFIFLLVTSVIGLVSLLLIQEHRLHKSISREG